MEYKEYKIIKRDKNRYLRRANIVLRPEQIDQNIVLSRNQFADKAHLREKFSVLNDAGYDVNSLTFQNVTFSDKKIDKLAEAIRDAKDVKELYFQRCKLRSEHHIQLYKALEDNTSITTLCMQEVQVLGKPAEALAAMLVKNHRIQTLKLNDNGIGDVAMSALSYGISKHPNLEHLDLKGNLFEEDGLEALLVALFETLSCKTLYLSGFKVADKNAECLAELLSHEQCKIADLELNETEISDESLKLIMEATQVHKKIQRISFSRTKVTKDLCSLMEKSIHGNFNALCMNHGQITDEKFNILVKGLTVGNQNLQYLNLSWNKISTESVENLCQLVTSNRNLTKLLLQHNQLGQESAEKLCRAFEQQANLRYLDISKNNIQDEGLRHFASYISGDSCQKLRVFECRKNNVKGIKGLFDTLIKKGGLTDINFNDNDLSYEIGKEIHHALGQVIGIQEFQINNNKQIPYSMVDKINKECAQNVQIQEFILNQNLLPEAVNIREAQNRTAMCFQKYDVSKLKISNESYHETNFMMKFIQLNNKQFQDLHLVNVGVLSNMIHELKNCRLSTLHIENCQMCPTFLPQLLHNLRELKNLKNLALIQIEGINEHTRQLNRVIRSHRTLRSLNLSQNNFTDYSQLVKLIRVNNILDTIDITGCPLNEDQIEEFWLSIHNNISLHTFLFDKFEDNHLEEETICQISVELKWNKIIQEKIMPKQPWEAVGNARKEALRNSLTLTNIKLKSIEPTLKLINLRRCQELNLTQTQIQPEQVITLIDTILIDRLQVKKLNLSQNFALGSETWKHLSQLLQHNASCITYIDLSKNDIKTSDLLTLLKALDINMILETLIVNFCSLQLETESLWKPVLEALEANCSLTTLSVKGNEFESRFISLKDEELAKNKKIVELIFPMLRRQQQQHAGNSSIGKTNKNSIKVSNIGMSLKRNNNSYGLNQLKKDSEPNISNVTNENSLQAPNQRLSKIVGKQSALTLQPTKVKISRKITIDYENQSLASNRLNQNKQKSILSLDEQSNQQYECDLNSNVNQTDSNSHANSSFLHSGDENEEQRKNTDNDSLKTSNFQLKLRGKNLDNLDFLNKFLKQFPMATNHIDLGENNLSSGEMEKLAVILRGNTYIQNINIDDKKINQTVKQQLNDEIQKNKLIDEHLKVALGEQSSTNVQTLNFKGKKIKDIGFVHKWQQEIQNKNKGAIENFMTCLENLDFADNDLGNQGCKQVAKMLRETPSIKKLDISHNNIGMEGLQTICEALTDPDCKAKLVHLDIRKNVISDSQLKILYSLVEMNESIESIKYTTADDQNVKRLELFKQYKHLKADEIEKKLLIHEERKLKCWQKAILPYWLWVTLIHYKHEAFRFKYHTESLNNLEKKVMKPLKYILYVNAFIYYLIMFVCPFVFINPCGEGLNMTSHYIYGAYAIANFIFELGVVCIVQKKIHDKSILDLNPWHFIELLFGQIAKLDTYLCVCFLSLVLVCDMWFLAIPVIVFIALTLIFPIYILIETAFLNKSLLHTQPLIEATAKICFVREQMMLATIFDSFCINNFTLICGKQFVTGKIMAIHNFVLQDFPQTLIHLLFLFLVTHEEEGHGYDSGDYGHDSSYHEEDYVSGEYPEGHEDGIIHRMLAATPHLPHSDGTVVASLIMSLLAVCISFFNLVMFGPNTFDPLVLQVEFKRRQEENESKKVVQQRRKSEAKFVQKRESFTQILGKDLEKLHNKVSPRLSSQRLNNQLLENDQIELEFQTKKSLNDEQILLQNDISEPQEEDEKAVRTTGANHETDVVLLSENSETVENKVVKQTGGSTMTFLNKFR